MLFGPLTREDERTIAEIATRLVAHHGVTYLEDNPGIAERAVRVAKRIWALTASPVGQDAYWLNDKAEEVRTPLTETRVKELEVKTFEQTRRINFLENRTHALSSTLLAILVLDLGYDHEPPYGHAPMRHQFAWKEAVEGQAGSEVMARVGDLKHGSAAEGFPFVDYCDRELFELQSKELLAQAEAHLSALREISLHYPPKFGLTFADYATKYLDVAKSAAEKIKERYKRKP